MSTEQPTVPEATKEAVFCPRCSYNVDMGKPVLIEDIKQAHTRSLLGEVPFSWTYDVQGVSFTFTDLTHEEAYVKETAKRILTNAVTGSTLLDYVAERLRAANDLEGLEAVTRQRTAIDGAQIDSNYALLDAMFYLRKAGKSIFTAPTMDSMNSVENIAAAINNVFGDKPETFISLVVSLSDVFLSTLIAAKEVCFDSDFYKAAGYVQQSEPNEKGQ